MKGMILAAGCGQRLRPLTHLWPKPLFPLCHQPLLGWTFRYLARYGIQEVVINLYHLAPLIQRFLADELGREVKVHCSYESELLGTAGGVKKAEVFLNGEAFVLINSDILIDLDLDEVIAFHRAKGALATLVLRADPEVARFGAIGVDATGRIRQFLRWTAPGSQPPLTDLMFTGVHILEPQVLELIPNHGYHSISEELYPKMIEQGLPLYGYVAKGYWMDIGTPQRYLQVHRDILGRKAPYQVELPEDPPGVWLGDGLSLGKGVKLLPPVALGHGCLVEDGCVIGPWVVIGNQSRLDGRVYLRNSVLWDEIHIHEDCMVKRSILGRGVTLPPETKLWGKMAASVEGALQMVDAE